MGVNFRPNLVSSWRSWITTATELESGLSSPALALLPLSPRLPTLGCIYFCIWINTLSKNLRPQHEHILWWFCRARLGHTSPVLKDSRLRLGPLCPTSRESDTGDAVVGKVVGPRYLTKEINEPNSSLWDSHSTELLKYANSRKSCVVPA